ncbi:MAG: methyltransferase domain-containing protein [Clostridia bacterium]|nr:methyltransferase domain-containing protein [Clostridia bacterium]
MEKDYNVFLCYRGEGGMLASNIYSDLCTYSKNKLKLFYAPKCIKHGENFMSICKEVASKVSLMILILTPGFFSQCRNDDDVVLQELRSALSNPTCAFLPIITPRFAYDVVALEEFFTEQEIDRIKHINAIKYNDVYSFNSMELLLPILKDKVGATDYDEIIQSELLAKQARTKRRVHIHDENKTGFFSQENKVESRRLETQQRLLFDFDMPVYEKYLEGKSELNVLDVGCGNGKALMTRLGNRPEVSKIIGIEYDQTFVDKAKNDYAGTKASFYQMDAEADDFIDNLRDVMDEQGIEGFDWINILAVMSHLKSPYQLLKSLRKVCNRGAVIFIRNIDDGLNFVHPDEKLMFERSFNMIAKCDTTGYRYSGRELFTLLHRAGYRDIVYEKMGINSATMDYSEKEALFDTIFIFLKNSINVTAKNNPYNQEIQVEKEWLDEHFEDLEEQFLSSDSFVNFGFLIVVAKY